MNAQIIDYDKLRKQVDAHPYPLLFATISGAHLYGFPSADSDFDLRGVHLLPLEQVVGLDGPDGGGEETVEKEGIHDGIEMDLVTHDAKKFFGLMLKKNGYVLEQLLSPLVVHTTPEHDELKAIAKDCITRHHAHHYLGFAARQWQLFRKEDPPRVKPLLYVYRVLLTGIHLMRTGEVEANLLTLNETAKLPYIDELVERKLAGPEKGWLDSADVEFYQREFERLVAELETVMAESTLPEQASGKDALNDLLVRLSKYRSGTPWNPPFLTLNKYHLSKFNARKEVIRLLTATGNTEPSSGWKSVQVNWKDTDTIVQSFEELVQEARLNGTIPRIQDHLDKIDSVFGHGISYSSTPNFQLKQKSSFAGREHEVQGPCRSAFSERDLVEDILYYRIKACELSCHYDFQPTCRYYRAYLFACLSIVDAFINRHILLAEYEGFSTPEFEELKSATKTEDRIRLWFAVCSSKNPQKFFKSKEWCHFQELRTKRNEVTHAVEPIGAYSLRDIHLYLNKVRTGVGGLLLLMRNAHEKPTLGFIERLRSAPLVDFRQIRFRADGLHHIKEIKGS
ncbi:putative nucleotidyltransferase [Bythopirellula polymerisocia]|uniref:Putative nucleotidyltransferase n=1 Tax=Bythopirellula polymerisocia TaxID=2528003 RepID=A0A5C6D119_9BACT|nr:putative nucleotidyltransferase [Bythopirellula polymerisocia]